jgi:hypothetical protein
MRQFLAATVLLAAMSGTAAGAQFRHPQAPSPLLLPLLPLLLLLLLAAANNGARALAALMSWASGRPPSSASSAARADM